MTPIERDQALGLLRTVIAKMGLTMVARKLVQKHADGTVRVRRVRCADGSDRVMPKTYHPAAIRMVSRCQYRGNPDRVLSAVLDTFAQEIECPHTGELMTQHACANFATGPMPRGNGLNLMHWHACKTCPHRPEHGECNER